MRTGAYHAWTVPSLGTLRFYPEYVSTKEFPLILLGPKRPLFLIDGEAKPFDPSSSVRAFVKLQDIQWHTMQIFERDRLLMRCDFLSEISNQSLNVIEIKSAMPVRLVHSP